jgi:L-alanine-DL-glutamate epimerase-like enolase superfamily enzyme
MKITSLEVVACRLPLTPIERGGIAPYQLSYRLATHADRFFIAVHTDEGITGWGEGELTIPAPSLIALYQHDLAHRLAGSDPRRINDVRMAFAQSTLKKYLNDQVFLAPVEIACWDILGQSLGVPIHMLLGGKRRDRVACAFPVGVLPIETLLGLIDSAQQRGFEVIKLKGERDFRRDVERMACLAQRFPTLRFRVDPNQAWTIAECVNFVHSVDARSVEYLEQPTRVQSLEEMARLRLRSPVPIALNDDCYGPWALDAIVRAGAADVAIVDLEPLGGMWGLVRAAHFAETANLALTHHTGFDYGIKTAAVVHAVSSLPAFRTAIDSTYMSQDDDVIQPRLELRDGQLVVPDGPGLGVRVDTEKLREYRLN